ncbi:hypothetical protein FLT15_17690 [Paenibacillus thiaminolyticus]|uniref:hypothetical protein n=1 Tax=Paenibacillus thiaminolyticus TaxID=49283 RepID=UPI0013F659F3|nr:hypothetical protein [Paenibacillus thiaminolyticus]NGP60103.1 hypothetical protein [Paenibacillus thiaminolyticus]
MMILEAPDAEPNAQAVKEGRQEAYRVAESAAVYRIEERVTRQAPALERLPEAGGALRASLQADAWQLAEALQGRLVSDEELVSLMEDKGWQDGFRLGIHLFNWDVSTDGWRCARALCRWRMRASAGQARRCPVGEQLPRCIGAIAAAARRI